MFFFQVFLHFYSSDLILFAKECPSSLVNSNIGVCNMPRLLGRSLANRINKNNTNVKRPDRIIDNSGIFFDFIKKIIIILSESLEAFLICE